MQDLHICKEIKIVFIMKEDNLKTLARGEVAPKLSFLLCTIS